MIVRRQDVLGICAGQTVIHRSKGRLAVARAKLEYCQRRQIYAELDAIQQLERSD